MASGIDLIASLRQPFLAAGGLLTDALLVLDAGAGEAIQSLLGVRQLLGLRVPVAFDLATPADQAVAAYGLLAGKEALKLVVILTQPLTSGHKAVLRLLQAMPTVRACTILCSVSEEAHAAVKETSLGEDAYLEYENALKEDLADVHEKSGKKGCELPSLDIRYFSLQACALSGSIFTLPAASAAACWSSEINRGGNVAAEAEADPSSLKLLAHSLVDLGATLDCRFETFSLGPQVAALGGEVCNLLPPETQGGRQPQKTASLVLLDRSLDLLTPSRHGLHPLEQVFGTLRRRACSAALGSGRRGASQTLDVAVPLERPDLQSGAEMDMPAKCGSLLPAFSPGRDDSTEADQLFQELLAVPGKEASFLLRKRLREAVRREGLQLPRGRGKPGAIYLSRSRQGASSAEELWALIEELRSRPMAAERHAVLVQLACAVASSTSGPAAMRREALLKQENQLALLSTEGADSIAAEIEQLFLLSCKHDSPLRLSDCLLLALRGFVQAACAAPHGFGQPDRPIFDENQRRRLKRALTEAMAKAVISEDDAWLGALHDRLLQQQQTDGKGLRTEGADALQLELRDKAADILEKLERLGRAQATNGLKTYSDEIEAPRTMIEDLVSSIHAQQPVNGMQLHSASLRNFLNTGLGRFGLKQRQPMPSDHDTVVIFVLGGISIGDALGFTKATGGVIGGRQFLLGGTTLLSPSNLLKMLS